MLPTPQALTFGKARICSMMPAKDFNKQVHIQSTTINIKQSIQTTLHSLFPFSDIVVPNNYKLLCFGNTFISDRDTISYKTAFKRFTSLLPENHVYFFVPLISPYLGSLHNVTLYATLEHKKGLKTISLSLSGWLILLHKIGLYICNI